MTSDVKLPEARYPLGANGPALFTEEQVRACVAHATAAKDAEIEALRAEVAKQSAYAKRTHDWNTELLANNERLAEALLEARRLIRNLLPDATFTQWDALLNLPAAQEGKGWT